jgi:hypothetical protein
MITPTVTEIPRRLDAVGRDTFIDAPGPVPHSRPRSLSVVRANGVRRLPSAAQAATSPGARPLTFPQAA